MEMDAPQHAESNLIIHVKGAIIMGRVNVDTKEILFYSSFACINLFR